MTENRSAMPVLLLNSRLLRAVQNTCKYTQPKTFNLFWMILTTSIQSDFHLAFPPETRKGELVSSPTKLNFFINLLHNEYFVTTLQYDEIVLLQRIEPILITQVQSAVLKNLLWCCAFQIEPVSLSSRMCDRILLLPFSEKLRSFCVNSCSSYAPTALRRDRCVLLFSFL